jgi:tetratricopeptide (TPR) repeat protein
VLKALKRYEEALADFDKALALKPDDVHAFGGLADAALKSCEWARMARIVGELPARLAAGCIVPPLSVLGYSGNASLQLQCAKTRSDIWSRRRRNPCGRGKRGLTASCGSPIYRPTSTGTRPRS